jgi:hypothetical protein
LPARPLSTTRRNRTDDRPRRSVSIRVGERETQSRDARSECRRSRSCIADPN